MRLPHTYLKVKSLEILPVANMDVPLPKDFLADETYTAKFDTENLNREMIQSLAKLGLRFYIRD